MKSEPQEYSIDDLAREGRSSWFGVRNYQARNFMRDRMQVGELAFFYHSSCPEPGIAGICRIASPAHPDASQFDPASPYFDPKATRERPIWWCVDVEFVERVPLIPLAALRAVPELADLIILKRGNRLSITPVEEAHWRLICERFLRRAD
ncbi:MAG: EVE domain-containing protein [Casimicrobiaceae bacterium]|nr:EVE domain-containing protein [Casimicrobiaceae bacterium]MCX8097967.1 EVE domain-containing protein [Casimicrobiaceae bacterium]MDW8311871.1 EVE domain-containing protein [Burkholderiales bacterium]